MEKRSSKYDVSNEVVAEPKRSRSSKNRFLYDEVSNGIGYDEIVDLSNISSNDNSDSDEPVIRTREDYEKQIDLKSEIFDEEIPVKEEKKEKPKVYDINSVLEEAKKNRDNEDQINKQKNEYSIVSDLSSSYRKKEGLKKSEEDDLKELINTITSNTLVQDIKDFEEAEEDDGKDLMSDLMATSTNVLDNISLEDEIAKEILNEKKIREVEKSGTEEIDEVKEEDGKLVNSFYTRSMDLSEQDFEIRDEIIAENKAKTKIVILLVLIFIVIVAIIVLGILKSKGII